MTLKENLIRLRSAISGECELRMNRDGRLCTHEVAVWIIRHKRKLALSGLADLVCQVMDRTKDEDMARRLLKRRPELREHEPEMRQISETLGVPLWYLLELPDEKARQAYGAACLIHELRAAEARAAIEAMQHLEELLRPALDGHPERTAGEAFRIIQQETDKTIRNLEE